MNPMGTRHDCGPDISGSAQGPMADFSEHSNKLLVFYWGGGGKGGVLESSVTVSQGLWSMGRLQGRCEVSVSWHFLLHTSVHQTITLLIPHSNLQYHVCIMKMPHFRHY
jgi:hypothetical protein